MVPPSAKDWSRAGDRGNLRAGCRVMRRHLTLGSFDLDMKGVEDLAGRGWGLFLLAVLVITGQL